MFILQSNKATKQQSNKATKRKNVKNKSRAFTLLETVFTITIIGILLAIFLPVMSAIKLSAQKLKDASNLKTIAAAWRECTINRGWVINGIHPNGNRYATYFIEQLGGAGNGKSISDIVLNDPYVCISPGDKYASKIVRDSLCVFNPQNGGSIVPTATFTSNISSDFAPINDACITSYCFMLNLPSNIPLNTTPLAFTRGLREDGKWDEKSGLYGSKGGYVLYADGHVVWFDGDKPAKFLHWNGEQYTSNIRQTVPNSTWITCSKEGAVNITYKSEGSLVVLYHPGTGGD
jgi:prepilin-type processing-associated H-X9-DG protein